jgi:3',5'-cyclic AMP phosphodiesterase CpdA
LSVLLQISDPHFGTERSHVAAALQRLVRRVEPALVVVSGDITQRARRHQFAAAGRFFASLSVPHVLAIPGNHDIPLFNPASRILFPYSNYARVFGKDLEPEYRSASWFVLCVNTTRRLLHTDGAISSRQVNRIAAQLRQAAPGQVRVVVTHQPVHVIRDKDVKNLVRGHERAVRAWSEAGADLILGGHIHLPYVRPLSDAFSDLPRRTWAVQAGTSVSSRVRSGLPNSVNLVHHRAEDPAGCRVERWDFDDRLAEFGRVESLPLGLDR